MWVARHAPTGNTFATYAWTQQGNIITFWFRVSTDTPGKRVEGLVIALPPEIPHPDIFGDKTPAELFVGAGLLSKSPIISTDKWRKPGRSAIVTLRSRSQAFFEVCLLAKPIAATHAWGMIQYHT